VRRFFDLHCPDGPPELLENYGFSRRNVATIEPYLAASLSLLCQAWEEIHGIE
jgi:hypothetical protein